MWASCLVQPQNFKLFLYELRFASIHMFDSTVVFGLGSILPDKDYYDAYTSAKDISYNDVKWQLTS